MTIIGVFITGGIYLDILCACNNEAGNHCCKADNYVISFSATPFIIGISWLIVNKVWFDYFLKEVLPRDIKTKKKKRAIGGRFQISGIICTISMVVIVIAGLIGIGIYSFRFGVL